MFTIAIDLPVFGSTAGSISSTEPMRNPPIRTSFEATRFWPPSS
jgi:hypothetical protein